jgi:hypothetical protein
MIVRFEASVMESGLDEDNDPKFMAVFVANIEQSHYLRLERVVPFGDEEDWGVHFEVDDQIYSGYEVIASCVVSPSGIRLSLTEPISSGTKHVEGVDVMFAATRQPPSEWIETLRSIFTGREQLLRVVDSDGI